MHTHQLEAYWSVDGQLTHGTIYVEANTAKQAVKYARSNKLKPDDELDHFDACSNDRWPKNHYDIEILDDEAVD